MEAKRIFFGEKAMRIRFLLILIWLSSFLGCSWGEYLPLKLGNTWSYTTNLGHKMILKVTRTEQVGGAKCYVLESCPFFLEKLVSEKAVEDLLFPGKQSFQLYKRYFMENNQEILFSPPKAILHYPLTVGKIWRWSGKQGEETSEYLFKVEGIEKLHTLGKDFECVKVSMTSSKKNATYENIRWYARGVGILREESYITSGPGKKIELILELMDYKLK